jgi:hypothetical protein
MKRNKYRAVKVKAEGITFDSKLEYKRYQELKLLEHAGEIKELRVHPKYVCDINNIHVANIEMDFEYWDVYKGRPVVEDVKGYDNPLSKLKRKLLKATHGITVELIRK